MLCLDHLSHLKTAQIGLFTYVLGHLRPFTKDPSPEHLGALWDIESDDKEQKSNYLDDRDDEKNALAELQSAISAFLSANPLRTFERCCELSHAFFGLFTYCFWVFGFTS